MRTLLSLVSLLILTGCSREPVASPPAIPADAVATAGNAPVLQKDLDHALTISGNRPAADVLQTLAEEESLAQLARAEGLDNDPSVRAAIRRLLAARVRERHSQPVTVTEDEIESAASSSTPSAKPERLHLAFLRQKFSTAGSEQAAVAKLKAAEEKWKSLPADASPHGFGTLAVEYSDDGDTRYQGGDAGWIVRGERHLLLPPEATAAIADVPETGLLPNIIVTRDAAWLILLLEIKQTGSAPVSRQQIRNRLTAAKESAQKAALLERATSQAPVKILVQFPNTAPAPGIAAQLPPSAPAAD